MSDTSKRIGATRLLRDIFIISLVVAICSSIVTIITVALWNLPVIPAAAGITVTILETAFSIISVVVIVMIAATFVFTIKLNKQCLIAFFVAIIAAILAILACVFQYTLSYRITAYVLEFISELAIACSLYILMDGLYGHKNRNKTLNKYIGAGCSLMVLSSLFTFIAFATRVNAAFTTLFYTMGLATYIAYSAILLVCMNKELNNARSYKEEPKLEESEAL